MYVVFKTLDCIRPLDDLSVTRAINIGGMDAEDLMGRSIVGIQIISIEKLHYTNLEGVRTYDFKSIAVNNNAKEVGPGYQVKVMYVF